MKKFLAVLLCLCLLGSSALAAEGPAPESVPAPDAALAAPADWALPYIADAAALKLLEDGYNAYLTAPVTAAQTDALVQIAADKLALLGAAAREGAAEGLVVDGTRGGVANALYQAYAAYDFPYTDLAPAEALSALGVLRGDGVSLALERTCTFQEAAVMTTRLILAAYDGQNAGSKGLLWKATDPETGNTLYLLGTAHLDRGDLYPFHKTLRDAITGAETVILELDFNDAEGLAQFAAMQTYSDGTGLKDHISPELYARTVALFAQLGLSEEQVNLYKPWALATTLTSLLTGDQSAGAAPMAIDLYVNAAAANTGVPVKGAESYALQGGIFDTLSPEYQENYLAAYVDMAAAAMSGDAETDAADPTAQAALAAQEEALNALVTVWKAGDVAGFEALYGKEAIVNSDDELNARLFTDRDPGMIRVAAEYLGYRDEAGQGGHTYFMAVGAGHMVDPGGIVSGLRALGYTVEQVG